MKKTIIIFDLFDTVINDVSVNFNRGLKIFWSHYFSQACTYEEMVSYGEELFEVMRKRQKENIEVSFIKDEVPLYFERFGVQLILLTENEEWEIAEAINEEILLPEVKETLDLFRNQKITMYVLSNCIFRANSLRKLLKKYGVDYYFSKIWSSADYGKRKPDTDFFMQAINEIIIDNPGVVKEDIIFVGNSFKYDVLGGTNAGLRTVWLNVEGQPNTDDLPVTIINCMNKLPDVI